MIDELFNRRKRMLTLLSARNKHSVVFKAVADESNAQSNKTNYGS